MDAVAAVRQHIGIAHWILEGTIEGVTTEQAHWQPAGRAHSIAANYAHVVLSEDMVVQQMLQGKALLAASTWAGKTGVSSMPEGGGAEGTDWDEWAKSVKVDLPALRQYAQAVSAATDAYLAGMKPEDLDREIDSIFMGKQSINFVIGAALLGNLIGHSGEISVAKGLQGHKGYPF